MVMVYLLLATLTCMFAMMFLMFLNQLDMQKKIKELEQAMVDEKVEKSNLDYILNNM